MRWFVQAFAVPPWAVLQAWLRRGPRAAVSAWPAGPVRALRAAAGAGWWVRCGGAWHAAQLLRSWRGPGWLTLALAAPGASARPLHVTVWRCAVAPQGWRRLRALAAMPARPAQAP